MAILPYIVLLASSIYILARTRRRSYYVSDHASISNEYDIIIVGGGTSGCVLASRLSEDPTIRVLMIEAGTSGKAQPFSRIPSGFSSLLYSKHSYQLYTEPQEHAAGKKKFIPRAKLLGGCTSMNGSIMHFCSPSDFDEWAKTIRDESWSWKNLSKYFRKMERFTPGAALTEADAVHGTDGPATVGYFSAFSEMTQRFVNACQDAGIKSVKDFNRVGEALGVGRFVTFVDSKLNRVSSETAYLTDDVLSRKNLTVVVEATVTRILTTDGCAVGVEFGKKSGGKKVSVRARREVILSAGAIHSPQILLLSGIGPAEELKKHGIPVVRDVPGVGQNLMDHALVDVYFKDRTKEALNYLLLKHPSDYLRMMGAVFQFYTTGAGPLASNYGEAAAFVRSDDSALFPGPSQGLKDTTSSSATPDLELFMTPVAYKDHGLVGIGDYSVAFHAALLRPESKGYVALKSSDPWEFPRIDPKFLQAPEDVEKLVLGVKLLLRIAEAKSIAPTIDNDKVDDTFDHHLHLKSDEELRQVVRSRVEHLYHPTSTCRMAPIEDNGVVDSKLRVYGIDRLRICDASVFSVIVSGHPVAACLAIAEKLADDIKSSWNDVKH